MSYFRAVVKKNAVLDTKKSKDSPKENQVDKSSEKVNDTALGAVDFGLLQNEENVTNRRSTKYTQYSNKNRYDIGKYAAENGNANAVRFFQK